MIWKHKQDTESFEARKELAIAAITSLYNAVPESRKLRDALQWALGALEEQEEK